MPQTLANIGDAYHDGEGVEKDLTEAAKYYQLAVDKAIEWAQESLDICLKVVNCEPQEKHT